MDDLADDILVCDANDQPVARGGVLVLVLDDHAAARLEIGLALTAATVVRLVALEVSIVFHNLDKRHGRRRARGGRAGSGAGTRRARDADNFSDRPGAIEALSQSTD